MSENKETHEIITPVAGHKVVLVDWISGRQKQKIDGAMIKTIEAQGQGKDIKPVMSDTMISVQENAAIETVVVSVDGSTENILDTVLDMRAKDFTFILDACQNIVDSGLDEKKVTSSKTNIIKS